MSTHPGTPKPVSHLKTLAVPGLVALLAALLLWRAPAEQTLGSGIKIVYLHVALIWVGMAGIALSGLLGLATAVFPRPRLAAWLHAASWTAFAFYAAGAVVSLAAEIVNWGAIFWQEPRTAAILQVLAVAVIVQVTHGWPLDARLKGTLHAALAGFMLWATTRAGLVLHPDNPIGSSSSAAIRFAFFGLFGLFAVAAGWLTWLLQRRSAAK
ncbi:MAG: hypothetical protein KC425_15070 [Anaerolineales bacterium]|nr:hypothetical protein [Anaerolineales bacterium]